MTRFDQIIFLSLLVSAKCFNITSIPLLEITKDSETTRPPLLVMTEQGLIVGKFISKKITDKLERTTKEFQKNLKKILKDSRKNPERNHKEIPQNILEES